LLISQEDGSGRTKGRAGFRKDVMGILAKDGELEVPMLRWPGGGSWRHAPFLETAHADSYSKATSFPTTIGRTASAPSRIARSA
jgi:hypothetical protein